MGREGRQLATLLERGPRVWTRQGKHGEVPRDERAPLVWTRLPQPRMRPPPWRCGSVCWVVYQSGRESAYPQSPHAKARPGGPPSAVVLVAGHSYGVLRDEWKLWWCDWGIVMRVCELRSSARWSRRGELQVVDVERARVCFGHGSTTAPT